MKFGPQMQAKAVYLASRAGVAGAIGVAAAATALALVVVTHVQLTSANRALQDDMVQLRAQLVRASAPGAALINPADAVGAVAGQLPSPDRIAAFIEDVQSTAAHGGVQIDRTEYRMQSALEKRAVRLQLVMPAHASYPQLRGWLETLLQTYPTAALDEVILRRQSEGAAQLEAHVALSLYSQGIR